MATPLDVGLVFLGGACGAAARCWALKATVRGSLRRSTGLFLINGMGCVLAGIVVAALAQGIAGLPPEATRLVLLTGLLGGYTTFSAVSLECAAVRPGAERRYVLIETAISVILAAPLARLGLMIGGV